MKRFFMICFALIERETAGKLHYRFAFFAEFITALIYFAGIFYVGKLIPRELIFGKDYFTMTVIGIGIFGLVSALFSAPRNFLTGEITMGTFETMMTLGPSVFTYVIAASIVKAIRALGRAVIILAIAYIFGADIHFNNTGVLLLILLLTAGAGLGAGFLFAAVDMRMRTSGRIIALFGGAGSILTGVYFPVSLLPKSFKLLSSLLPTTHAIFAARQALLFDIFPINSVLILFAFAVILLSAGFFFLRLSIEQMKKDGSFCYY